MSNLRSDQRIALRTKPPSLLLMAISEREAGSLILQ